MKLSRLMRIIDEHKLTPSDMRLFFLVCEEHPASIPQAQVGEYPATLGMPDTSVSKHLKKLEAIGWLRRSKVDKKSFQIELTLRGLTLWEFCQAKVSRSLPTLNNDSS
jgi:DNA-binding MarR family transcriptional regulator|tara:strand:- start:1198 stop:1521 length:324 start_codon:yes stop_codon:yes gene_type:complete